MIRTRAAIVLAALGLGACVSAPPVPPAAPAVIDVQILAFNDFHGSLEASDSPVGVQGPDGKESAQRLGGAAALAATLAELRSGQRHSITVSAGDLIGASPLISSYFLDEPTIAAMNLAGLELNAVGNHEFDRGSAELLRIQSGGCAKYTSRQPCQIEPFAGARFKFLAANVERADGTTLFPGSFLKDFGPVEVGFIGMTLKDTGMLVSPAGVRGLTFRDEAASANALVPQLKAQGADAIVLLIHQGGESPITYRLQGCDSLAGPILDIIDGLDPAITTIVSGHTHQAYACEIERGGTKRLLTSAGRYGYLVTDIRMRFDPALGVLLGSSGLNVPVAAEREQADPRVAALVETYAAAAAPAAGRIVGRLGQAAPFSQVRGESPAARLIADAQLAATRSPRNGGADMSFINGGGVRAGLNPGSSGIVTYGQIFAMQPFGNSIVVKAMTGAQVKAMLEQQFAVRDGSARVAALMIPSANFRFDYDLSRPQGQRIVAMRLDGKPLDLAALYRVSVNNFLASGGDGFTVLTEAETVADAGLDLDALEAYLATDPAVATADRVRDVTAG